MKVIYVLHKRVSSRCMGNYVELGFVKAVGLSLALKIGLRDVLATKLNFTKGLFNIFKHTSD